MPTRASDTAAHLPRAACYVPFVSRSSREEDSSSELFDLIMLLGIGWVAARVLFPDSQKTAAFRRGAAPPPRRTAPLTATARAYQLLGARPSMSFAELRECYRRAIFTAHPDRGGDTRAAIRVNSAWQRVQADHERRTVATSRPAYA